MLQLGALVKGGHRLSHEITIAPVNIEVSDPNAWRKYKGLTPSGMEIYIKLDGRDAVKPVYGSFPKSSSSHPWELLYSTLLKFCQRKEIRHNGNLLGGVLKWNFSTEDSVELWMPTITAVCPTIVLS
jgi:hypothetical protein